MLKISHSKINPYYHFHRNLHSIDLAFSNIFRMRRNVKKCYFKKNFRVDNYKKSLGLFKFYFLDRVIPRGLNNLVAIDTVAAIFSIT